jgi:hypothetical protein
MGFGLLLFGGDRVSIIGIYELEQGIRREGNDTKKVWAI